MSRRSSSTPPTRRCRSAAAGPCATSGRRSGRCRSGSRRRARRRRWSARWRRPVPRPTPRSGARSSSTSCGRRRLQQRLLLQRRRLQQHPRSRPHRWDRESARARARERYPLTQTHKHTNTHTHIHEYDSQYQNLASGQILQVDDTRAKSILIIQVTHIYGLNVVDGVYGSTTLTSGVQQGNAQNTQLLIALRGLPAYQDVNQYIQDINLYKFGVEEYAIYVMYGLKVVVVGLVNPNDKQYLPVYLFPKFY